MPLLQIGTALKKLMPKYRINYGCKTLGELYEQFDRYELQDGERGGWDGKKEITVTNCLKLPFASEYRKAGLVWRPA